MHPDKPKDIHLQIMILTREKQQILHDKITLKINKLPSLIGILLVYNKHT